MKNTMKKLMSLLLVAVLLVSAVPFQANAAGDYDWYFDMGESFTDNDGNLTGAEVYAALSSIEGAGYSEAELGAMATFTSSSAFPIDMDKNMNVVVHFNYNNNTWWVTSDPIPGETEPPTSETTAPPATKPVIEPIDPNESSSTTEAPSTTEDDDEPEYVTITMKFNCKDTKGNVVNVSTWTETWNKGVTIQKLWNEFHPEELDGLDWTAKIGNTTYPANEPINGSCTINFNTNKTVASDGSSDGVDYVTPSDTHEPAFTLIHMVNGKRNWTDSVEAGYMTFGDLKAMYFTSDEGYKYTMTSKGYPNGFYDNTIVPDGDTVVIRLTTDYKSDTSNGSGSGNSGTGSLGSLNGSTNNNNSNSGTSTTPNGTTNGSTYNGSNGGTEVNKFPYDVILNVYLNNQVGTIDRKITLNTGIALDGKVTLTEVKNLLKSYYTAKDSDGLNVDGLYFATGNWVGHFAYDMAKYETLNGLEEERKAHEVNIIVMLTNANRKTATVSSSDNPKTGDAIFACVSIMGVSATALAVLYFYNKKRAF